MIRKQSEKSNAITMATAQRKQRKTKDRNKLKLKTEERQYRKNIKDKCAKNSRRREGLDFNSASKLNLRQLQ